MKPTVSFALTTSAMRAWRLLRERALSGEKSLAGIGHSGFLQWLVRATFGCRAWMPLFSIANCGVFELIVTPTRSGLAYLQWRNLDLQAHSGATGFATPQSRIRRWNINCILPNATRPQ
jgi:hypothetical protein